MRLKPLIHLSGRARRINQNGFCRNLKLVPPFAQSRKYAKFAGVRQALPLQGADEFRLGAAQEGVGGFFQRDAGGQGGLGGRALLRDLFDAPLHIGVMRFAGQREAQVGGGVFVRAIHAGVTGQLREALQGVKQLRGRTFEVPAAACAEQRIAAKQDARDEVGRDEGEVIVEVAGDFEDIECDACPDIKRVEFEPVAFAQVVADKRIAGVLPSVYRHVVYFTQFCDAANVVGMAVGAQDDFQLQAARLEECHHRRGFAGIDHGGILVIVDRPDVIVPQGGDGGDVKE